MDKRLCTLLGVDPDAKKVYASVQEHNRAVSGLITKQRPLTPQESEIRIQAGRRLVNGDVKGLIEEFNSHLAPIK